MIEKDRINKEVSKRLDMQSILDQKSTQVQIGIEYAENEKAKHCMRWLLSIADERKNKKLYDTITLLSKRLEKQSKLISDLRHYESKSAYYEMMCDSLVSLRNENKILRDKLMSKF